MTKRQARQYEMLVRVRDFGTAHRDRFPDGTRGGTAFAAVGAAVAEIDASSVSRTVNREEGKRLKAMARADVFARIVVIARNVRVLGKSSPGADAKFQPPVGRTDLAVLTTAKAFLQEIAAVKDALVDGGLPATFVDDLQKATNTFEQAMNSRHDLRATSKADLAGITTALARGTSTARSLDVLVANIFSDDARVTAAWRSVRHVEAVGKPAASQPPNAPTVIAPTSDSATGEPLRKAS